MTFTPTEPGKGTRARLRADEVVYPDGTRESDVVVDGTDRFYRVVGDVSKRPVEVFGLRPLPEDMVR